MAMNVSACVVWVERFVGMFFFLSSFLCLDSIWVLLSCGVSLRRVGMRLPTRDSSETGKDKLSAVQSARCTLSHLRL
jgi:hypothetical protein